jgi:uncharacterized repeat protein (TIGR01451 family)
MWPGGPSDDFATAYALQLLLEAKDRQMPVPADLIAKANTYLQARLAANDLALYNWRTHTRMAYLLTRQGILVPAALANLREAYRQQIRKSSSSSWGSDIGTAYLAASFQLLKQDATGNELMQPVWDDFVQRVKERKPRNSWDYYYDPLVHDSTLILLAARHFPKRLAALPTESWNRLATMIGDGWYSTQSSAAVILAVDAYARAAANSANGQFDASAVDKAGKAAALAMTGELRALRQGAVPAGIAKLRLSNPGDLPLFYGWAESGYERNLPETAVTHGLEITQTILNEKGVAISEARIGEEVTVRVTVRAVDRDAVRQVALVDILPSGLEPVLQSAGGEDEAGEDTPPWMRRIGGSGSWQPDYVDVREDRVIFFGDVGTGTRDLTFKARATNVGQFSLPAAFGEAMYERRIYGRSAAGKFSVLPVAK